jgi:uncharacterized membrane protein YfcA
MVRPSSNALARWQRATILAAWWGLFVSGAAWLPVHYLWGAGAGELPLPIETWLMRAHGLAVVAGLFAFGLVAAGHVKHGWRRQVHRTSGLALCVGGGALAASGYALSYLLPEGWHARVGWAHAALGIAVFTGLLAHARVRHAAEAPAAHRPPGQPAARAPASGSPSR